MKSMVRQNAFPLYALTQVAYRLVRGYTNIRSWQRESGFRPLWQCDHLPTAAGRPIFILGSGASVNTYGDREWDAIRNGLSIGLNYWVFHDFVPDILMFELCGIQNAFFEALEKRQGEYADTLLVIRGNYLARKRYPAISEIARRVPTALRENTFLSWDFPVPGLTATEFEKSLGTLEAIGLFDPRTRFHITAQSKASLGYAVNFAIQSGADDIILCGVDLNSVSYFFSDQPEYLHAVGIDTFDTGQRGTVHKTDDPAQADLTISEALRVTDKVVCRPRGIRLAVGSRSSALFPSFPYYFDDVHECSTLKT